MANSVVSTVVHDGERNAIVIVTGTLDTSDLAVTDITTIANLNPVPTLVRLDRLQYSVEDGISCLLWWHNTSDGLIMPVEGRGLLDFCWAGGYNNPQAAGYTGNIRLSTVGWSGVKHFTLILDLVKQGVANLG